MIHQGYDHGNLKPVLVKRGFSVAAAGSTTSIPLDDLPGEDSGMPLHVVGFEVRAPTLSLTIPSGKHLDPVSIAQGIQLMSLSLAAGAPPSAYYGGDKLIDNIDGYTALQMLAFLSDMPVIEASQASYAALPAPTASSTVAYGNLAIPSSARRPGWLHTQAVSCGSASGGTAAFSDAPRYFLPVGAQYGEPLVNTAIPATWFNGNRGGRTSGNTGRLDLTFNTTIDGIAATWGSTLDLWALCVRIPRERTTVPTVPRIQRYLTSDRNIKTRPGIRKFLGFMKQLSAGAMQAHDYTRVVANCEGRVVNEQECDVQASALSYLVEREHFRFPRSEQALGANVNAARLARHCVPVLVSDGPRLQAPGSTKSPTYLDVVTTGETSHQVVDVTLTPNDGDVAQLAAEWAPVQGATVVSATHNGNDAPAVVAGLIPARAVLAK